MDDAEVDAELARMERAEAEVERRWDAMVAAIEAGVLGERYAGRWGDSEDRFFVAVKGEVAEAERALAVACPGVTVHIVSVAHSLAELERLQEELCRRGEELHVPLSAIGVDESANRIEVMLVDLSDPRSQALRREFEGVPVEWTEGEIVAAS